MLDLSQQAPEISIYQQRVPAGSAPVESEDPSLPSSDLSKCFGWLHDVVLVLPSFLFVLFLGFYAYKNLKKLYYGRSYIMISYYALLWLASLLNLAWCFSQTWQCTSGKEFEWNFLSLLTTSTMLCLEISLVAFLLQENYISGLESLVHNFIVSGIIVGVDVFLKAVYVFGLGVPLFIDSNTNNTDRAKWSLLLVHKLFLAIAYGFILFVHFFKWREKLPPRPSFYNYVIVMFATTAVALFACSLGAIGAHLGYWLYNSAVICYHALYLPFLYVTFLADFFQEEDFLLDSAYYSEMREAGFFDADWE